LTRMGEQRGSALLLFPAGVLVMLVLGAITVDFSIAFLGERELAGATAAAANDTAARALSDRAFYREGVVSLDEALARDIAVAAVRDALDSHRYHDLRVSVTVPAGSRIVIVSASAEIDLLFARALPAGPPRARVAATARAALAGPPG
jgi:Flp pilus assembly protein TadG